MGNYFSDYCCETQERIILKNKLLFDNCPICLEPICDLVITRCSHGFCHQCIFKWQYTSYICPLCRAYIDPVYPPISEIYNNLYCPDV